MQLSGRDGSCGPSLHNHHPNPGDATVGHRKGFWQGCEPSFGYHPSLSGENWRYRR